MNHHLAQFALIWLLLVAAGVCGHPAERQAAEETFAEEALVVPLPDGLVLVHLHFTQQAPARRHYTLFPRAVGQLAAAIPFESVQLSLTQGRWHYDRWGAPLLEANPAGAVLRAHFSPQLSPEQLPGLWGNLSHALGGLFCASLNFVARPEATAPITISMHPVPAAMPSTGTATEATQGGEAGGQDTAAAAQQQVQQQEEQEQQGGGGGVGWVPGASGDRVLYAALPQEASCTENLTPWLKLLPCRDAAGLGRLLSQRGVVFGADYHSLQVNIAVQRDSQQRPTHTTLQQTFTMVLRSPQPQTSSSGSNSSIRHHHRQPPQPGGVLSNVSLAALLGAEATGACPVASSSRLLLQLPQQLLEQQRQGEKKEGDDWLQELLQQLPAHTAPQPAVSAGVDSSQQDLQQHRQLAASAVTRAQQWSTPWFDLTPAPDAVAVLSSSSGAAHKHSQGSSSGGGQASKVLFAYDLWRSNPTTAAAVAAAAAPQPPSGLPGDAGADASAAAHAQRLPFNITWQQQQQRPADSAEAAETGGAGAAPSALPRFAVSRYITGVGQLHGGMVLELTATNSAAAVPDECSSSGSSSSACLMSVCILQVVPWYVRLWLHTLRLSIDGQHVPLQDHMLPSYISPARDRKQPLVLDLCLAVPRSAHSITLTAQFTKAFLRMLEHPPDAHRGFDVPAAIVTVGDVPASASPPPPQPARGGGAGAGVASSSKWRVVAAEGAASAEQLQVVTPLMAQLMQDRAPLVYSPGLVVPLAVPDFSMPYNVICLTSTVLAIFMGGVLNALLWRPGKEARDAADPKVAAQRQRKKVVRLVVLMIVFAGLALHYDADLQQEIIKKARALGLIQAGGGSSDEL